ncbi:MAG: hypothetical protein AAB152_00675 [Candidatus Coatesbacteria bacterium]
MTLAAALAAALLARTAGAFTAVAPDPAWPAAGVTVAVQTYGRGSLHTIPDGDGGLILAWQDARGLDPASCNCRSMDDLYAQRLDAKGTKRWGADDLAVCKWRGIWGGSDFLVGLYPDGAGGAVVAWDHADGPAGTFARRVTRDGTMTWGAEGSTVFEHELGLKFTARSARLGREVWLGLDAAEETRVRISPCVLSTRAMNCDPPQEFALPAQFQTVSILAGPSPGACLLVFTTRTGAGGICWAWPVGAGAPGEARRLLEADEAGFPVQLQPDGEGGVWAAAVVRAPPPAAGPPASVPAGTPLPPPFAGPGLTFSGQSARSAADAALPCDLRVQHGDAAGRPLWGPGVTVAAVASPATPFAIAASPRGDLAVGWMDAGDPAHIRVRFFDRAGLPRTPQPIVLADRAERTRPIGLLATPQGWIVTWTEWEAGATESLRAAWLTGAGAAPPGGAEPPRGSVVLRRNDAVMLERLVSTPGGAFVFAFDRSVKALLAFRLRAD